MTTRHSRRERSATRGNRNRNPRRHHPAMKVIVLLIAMTSLVLPCFPAAEPILTATECRALLTAIAKAELHRREEARNAERVRVEAFIREASAKLVEKLGGGADVRCMATDCVHDTGDAVWTMDLEVRWGDTNPSGLRYAVRGRLRVSEDGQHCTFTKLWSSQGVKDHAMFAALGATPWKLPPLAAVASPPLAMQPVGRNVATAGK